MYKNLVEKNNISTKQIQIPETFVPNPIESDYSKGFIERYFIQKTNDKASFVFEISSSTADEIKSNPNWKQIIVKWRIVGPLQSIYNEKTNQLLDNGVLNDNINAVAKAKKDIPNIGAYILNPLQFYRGKVS